MASFIGDLITQLVQAGVRVPIVIDGLKVLVVGDNVQMMVKPPSGGRCTVVRRFRRAAKTTTSVPQEHVVTAITSEFTP